MLERESIIPDFDNPIRVLHVIQYFDTGGLERMVHALAQGSMKLNVNSSVLAYLSDGPYRQAFEDVGIQTFFYDSSKRLKFDVSIELIRRIRKERIEILHTHHVGPFLYGVPASVVTNVPHIQTEHSRELYTTAHYRVLGRAMDHATTVVSVSQELSRYRKKTFGRPSRVIPNGVRVPEFDDGTARRQSRELIGIDANTFAIGCVARLSPEKDLGTLIRGFGIFYADHPDARLILIGGGPEYPALENLIAELNLKDAVNLLGLRSDVDDLLAAFDLIALSSTREGLPLALLEGMAHGIPAIATEVGAIPDLLRNGGGVTVPVQNPQAIAQAFGKMADNYEERLTQGLYARDIVKKSYSLKSMVDSYVELYRSMVKR